MNGDSNGSKKIVVDSSSLITISDNCIMKVVKHVAEREGISFIIPESVYFESVLDPLHIRQYELNALRIRDAVEEGYVKVVKNTPAIIETANRIQNITATLLRANGRELRLMQRGEAETLALLHETGSKLLLVDERTTRMLIENPEGLAKLLSKRHKCNVQIERQGMAWFSGMFKEVKVIRSVELICLAYEDGALGMEVHKSKQALEAALWAAKFSGCAVSEGDITAYLKKAGN